MPPKRKLDLRMARHLPDGRFQCPFCGAIYQHTHTCGEVGTAKDYKPGIPLPKLNKNG